MNGSTISETKTWTLNTYGPNESRRILKNVIVLSLSATLLLSGVATMNSLQSSINNDIPNQKGLGTYAQAAMFGSLVLSSLFITPSVIQFVKVKPTIVITILGVCVYMGAQFYATYYTLVPAAIVAGASGGPFWAAQCIYLTQLGHEYAQHTNSNSDVVIVRFFSIFFSFFQTHPIWGNLLSSLVLQSNAGNSAATDISTCGPNFCPHADEAESTNSTGDKVSNGAEEDRQNIYILAGVCFAFVVSAAIIVAIFADSMTRYGEDDKQRRRSNSGNKSRLHLATATFRHMRNWYQLLLIPITMWSGLEQGFLSSDITRAYIRCSWGIDKIGWTIMCYGIADAVGAFISGHAIRHVGRVPVFVFGACLNFGLLATLLIWRPTPDYPLVYFVVMGLWGLSDSIWQSQINAFYAVAFPGNEEAAFSNYRVWESIGFVISFVSADLICIRPKIYLLFVFLGLGMAGYLTIEKKIRKRDKKCATTLNKS